jgi:membrane fusion protein (multidrug efflux system)
MCKYRTTLQVSAACLMLFCSLQTYGQGRPPAPVIVAEVVAREVQEQISIVGIARPRRTSRIATETDGLVAQKLKDGGQVVKRGERIFRLTNDQLEADLDEARADLSLQSFNYEQSRKLVRTEAVAEQDLRNAGYQLARAKAKLRDLESRHRALSISPPFSGHIVQTLTEVGEWVSRGDEVAQVISTDTIRVYVNAHEKYVDGVELGDAAEVFIDALGIQPFAGTVVAILAEGYSDSHAFPVIVEVNNPEGRIRSNMSARVRLNTGSEGSSLLVHKDAVIHAPDGQVVFVVLEGKAVRRLVQTGLAHQGFVAVKGNLKVGDLAIVRGNERLRDGQAVKVVRKLQ